jgi:hypothetical protein
MYQLSGPPRLTNLTWTTQDDDKSKTVGRPSRSRQLPPSLTWNPKLLKEARTMHENQILVDRDNTPIRVFEGA